MNSDAIESAFRVPATLRSLTFVRCALALVLDREPWSPEDSGRLLLAASEAVSNAIEHGSPPEGGTLEIQVVVRRDGATLVVTDQGSGVEEPQIDALATPPSPTSPRGRGFPIMRSLADEVTVTRAGSGTRVAMRFAVEPEADELADPPEADRAKASPGGTAAGELVRLNRVQDV
jgi:serine/threonine-protein kinase RsbW